MTKWWMKLNHQNEMTPAGQWRSPFADTIRYYLHATDT